MKSYACGSTVGFASGDGGSSGAGTPMSISTSKCHFVPRASPVSRRLHCSPSGFLRTVLQISKQHFVPIKCSSDKASVSPPAATDPSVRELGCSHFVAKDPSKTDAPNTHKGDAYGAPNRYWNGDLPSGVTVNLVSTNPAQRTANETAGDVAEGCKQVLVSIYVR